MQWTLTLLLFISGLSFGSFLNAFEWRMKNGISLWKGRSKCPQCNREIRWYDNIPLISFFVLRRRCRNCKEKISWQYPLVELWMGLSFIFILYMGFNVPEFNYWHLALNCMIVWVLTFIFVYDLKYLEVVDAIVIPATIIVFSVSWISGFQTWENMVIGMSMGAGFFLAQYLVSRGKWVGGGDMRIGLLMGAVLGWKLLLIALWLSYVVGALVSVALLIAKKKNMKSAIPFGIFLTPATLVAMVWGKTVLDWYLELLIK